MTHFEALFLGVLQGVTEFLPISSSGHLVLAEKFFAIEGGGLAFDVFLHLGTLLAVLIYFWRDWQKMLLPQTDPQHRKLLFYLIVATIPGALAGFFLEDLVANHFRTPHRVAFQLAIMSLPLLVAEIFSRKDRTLAEINLPQALLIGTAQGLAVLPGTSRSGITMATGLLLGFKREAAARFSFLLSAPIIAGAGCYEALKVLKEGASLSLPYLTGFLAAFVSGFFVIAWLLRFLRTHTFYPFVVYRLLLACAVWGFS
ncbi:MAG: undecaprenyl-diphosphatase UppP [Thermodesulfobacteria bacterium]|nr:undecaprenyl-diphosphatase UppP [Thermodesulfobacteriota bacterium]